MNQTVCSQVDELSKTVTELGDAVAGSERAVLRLNERLSLLMAFIGYSEPTHPIAPPPMSGHY